MEPQLTVNSQYSEICLKTDTSLISSAGWKIIEAEVDQIAKV